MLARIVIIVAAFIMIITGVILVLRLTANPEFLRFPSLIGNLFESNTTKSSVRSESIPPATVSAKPKLPLGDITPPPSLKPTISPSSNTSTKSTTTCYESPNGSSSNTSQQKKSDCFCYKYTITHLDNSKSTLCYSRDDYEKLSDLGWELSSGKTFYQFHIDGARKYQELYDKNHSDLWLKAKQSSEQKADEEKQKIDQINLSMYNIEKRGR